MQLDRTLKGQGDLEVKPQRSLPIFPVTQLESNQPKVVSKSSQAKFPGASLPREASMYTSVLFIAVMKYLRQPHP